MGSMKMLMTFKTEENMSEAENSESLLKHFIEVRKWTSGEVNRIRRKWLEISRLPEHGWTHENMRKIGEVWGRVVAVQEEEGSHYNSFIVLVDSNMGTWIQARAPIVIEGECFQIFVMEVGGNIPWLIENEKEKEHNVPDTGLHETQGDDQRDTGIQNCHIDQRSIDML
ncbi:hypothetical protein PIB30_025203 [Stylosanthes scabra]|uniref:DUF4283 domain-containing protein n=1 Tax=Stylosanthes scabra TaxID=79078 RepID=A0ABU6Q9H4_9FABA|nr:hypothetical protein [Stylosanthes scabra]